MKTKTATEKPQQKKIQQAEALTAAHLGARTTDQHPDAYTTVRKATKKEAAEEEGRPGRKTQ